MTVRLYRSEDAGAPQLGAVGSINAILKACLVTGYGSRTPAGWSIAFEDQANNKIALRQGGANGRYLKLDHSADYRYARVNGYASMSDIDTGTEGMYDQDTYSGEPGGFFSGGNTTGGDMRWTVVADDRSFYYFPHYNWYSHCWMSFCGDIEQAGSGTPYSFAMGAYINASDAISGSSAQFNSFMYVTTHKTLRMLRGLSQLEGASYLNYINRVTDATTLASYVGSCSKFTYPDVLLGGLLAKPIEAMDLSTHSYCGRFPIVLEPINYYHDGAATNRAYSRETHHIISENEKLYYLTGLERGNSSIMFEVDVIDG